MRKLTFTLSDAENGVWADMKIAGRKYATPLYGCRAQTDETKAQALRAIAVQCLELAGNYEFSPKNRSVAHQIRQMNSEHLSIFPAAKISPKSV